MYMDDDDPKERNVRPTAANLFFASDQTMSAVPAAKVNVVSGNEGLEELESLFRDHYKGIFRVAFRITGSHSDAEDVLQTIFVRLTRGWKGTSLQPNPRAFLYRAAINAALDIVRLRKRTNLVPFDVIDPDRSTTFAVASPEKDQADSELRELFRQAVAKLEGRAASAFVLRYYEGYDNKRIAEILGTSQMVIGVTLHRARTRLRKEIGSYLEKHHDAK